MGHGSDLDADGLDKNVLDEVEELGVVDLDHDPLVLAKPPNVWLAHAHLPAQLTKRPRNIGANSSARIPRRMGGGGGRFRRTDAVGRAPSAERRGRFDVCGVSGGDVHG